MHGVLINNKLITRVQCYVQPGDAVECSLKSYLYYEPLFKLNLSVQSRLSWIYTYSFIANSTYLVGMYYRFPNPCFIPFLSFVPMKKKRKFLNFFIEYCYR